MPYSPYYNGGYKDWPNVTTPVTAAALNAIETGVTASGIWYNVKDPAYGAKGDGLNDDTTAIQAAINAAGAAGGGTVYFPAGTYRTTSTLTISSFGVVLQGAGCGTPDEFGTPPTMIAWGGSSSNSIVKINGPLANWGVRDIFLNGNGGANRGLEVVGGQAGFCRGLHFQVCASAIYSTTTAGGTHSTGDNRYQQIYVRVPAVNNNYGIYLDGNSDNLSNTTFDVFEDINFVFAAGAATNYGIYFARCDNVRFYNVVFNGSAGRNVVTFDYTGHSGWPIDIMIDKVDLGSATAVVSNVGSPPSNAVLNQIINVSRGNFRPADPALAGLNFGNTVNGTATLGWAGGSVIGNAVAVPHNLGVVPRTVTTQVMAFTGLNLPPVVECMSSFNLNNSIELRASTVDGQSPANTATVTVAWTASG